MLSVGFAWFRSCPGGNSPGPPSTLPQTLDSASLLWINTSAGSSLLQAPAANSRLPASACCCGKNHCPPGDRLSPPSFPSLLVLFPSSLHPLLLPSSVSACLLPSLLFPVPSFLHTFTELPWAMDMTGERGMLKAWLCLKTLLVSSSVFDHHVASDSVSP